MILLARFIFINFLSYYEKSYWAAAFVFFLFNVEFHMISCFHVVNKLLNAKNFHQDYKKKERKSLILANSFDMSILYLT